MFNFFRKFFIPRHSTENILLKINPLTDISRTEERGSRKYGSNEVQEKSGRKRKVVPAPLLAGMTGNYIALMTL